jgi:hypothetical protein
MLLCAPIPACSTLTTASSGISVAHDFCDLAKPIGWSERDTPETKLEVKQHNAAWIANCRKPAP